MPLMAKNYWNTIEMNAYFLIIENSFKDFVSKTPNSMEYSYF